LYLWGIMTKDKSDTKKKEMLESLRLHMGNISEACRAMNVTRKTHYKWYAEDEEYKDAVDDVNDSLLDFAESKMFQLINGVKTTKAVGDEFIVYDTPPCKTSIIFYLNNKGKRRGYNTGLQHQTTEQGEQAKITLPNGTQISI
jgi:hypothetical protein